LALLPHWDCLRMTVSSTEWLILPEMPNYYNMHDLHLIAEWCKLWEMRLNLDKCVTLQCYRTINPHLTNYLAENYTLKIVNQHLYLGVILDKTMSFTTHINATISKASKMLNFVKRDLSSCLKSTKEKAYLSRSRTPHVGICQFCMGPLSISSYKKIQKRAARWVLHDYSRHSSVTSILQQL